MGLQVPQGAWVDFTSPSFFSNLLLLKCWHCILWYFVPEAVMYTVVVSEPENARS